MIPLVAAAAVSVVQAFHAGQVAESAALGAKAAAGGVGEAQQAARRAASGVEQGYETLAPVVNTLALQVASLHEELQRVRDDLAAARQAPSVRTRTARSATTARRPAATAPPSPSLLRPPASAAALRVPEQISF